MALFYTVLATLCVAVLGFPYAPFDTYGPPEHEVKPEFLERIPIPKKFSPVVPINKITYPVLPIHREITPAPFINVPPPEAGEVEAPEDIPQTIVNRDKEGQYSFGIVQPGPNGQEVKEQGRLISTNEGWEYVVAKKGSYSYVSPEGTPIHVEWEADHNGFRITNNN